MCRTIQDLYRLLARDESRNDMIFDDVLAALEARRSPIVITERKDHLQTIAERLSRFAKNVIVLKGGMRAKERKQATEALEAVPDGEERVIVATGRYLGEGFDDARLDTLFLTMPISWRGTLAQYAGRLHRLHAAKREVIIYDYVDEDEPMLAKMAAKREAGYKALGYEVTHAGELFSRETCLPGERGCNRSIVEDRILESELQTRHELAVSFDIINNAQPRKTDVADCDHVGAVNFQR